MSINNYPRRGHRLAPQTLRDILDAPVPADIVGGKAADLRLCDLDESVWDRFTVEECAALADAVIACVRIAVTWRGPSAIEWLRNRLLPRPARGVQFEDLDLTVRTWNCLCKARLQEKVLSGELTVGEVLSLPSFGGRSLVDLLTSLEYCSPPPKTSASQKAKNLSRLVRNAQALLRLPESRLIGRDDPRLGVFLREVYEEETNLYGVALRIRSVKGEIPWDAAWLLAQLEMATQKLRLCVGMSLEEELGDLLWAVRWGAPENAERNHRILLRLLGWDGQGGCTLQKAGAPLDLTKERVRQIERRAVGSLQGRRTFAPALDRALAFVVAQLWNGPEEVARGLVQAGHSQQPFHPAGLVCAAEILGREAPFEIRGKRQPYNTAPREPDPWAFAHNKARQLVAAGGVTRVSEVLCRLPPVFKESLDEEQLVTMLKASGDFLWLDQPAGWFLLTRQKSHRYWLRFVNKVLSIAGEMEVGDLHACLLRYHWRCKSDAIPSPRAILALCAQVPGYRIKRNRIIADPPLDWRTALTPKERVLFSFFQEQGPLLFTDTLRELGRERGLGDDSLSVFLSAAPFIVKVAPALYSLVGSDPPALGPRFPWIREHAPLMGCDQTSTEQAWYVFRISDSMRTGGQAACHCHVEVALRGRYFLVNEDGSSCGKLYARKKSMEGLESFHQSTGAAKGDFLVLALHPKRRVAVACHQTPAEAFAEGFTCSPERLRALLHIAETTPVPEPKSPDATRIVRATTRRLLRHQSAVHAADVLKNLPEQWQARLDVDRILAMAQASLEFFWVDQVKALWSLKASLVRGWLPQIRKVVAVAGSIEVGALHSCLRRCHYPRGEAPSPEVLRALCAQSPYFRLDGDRIVADPPLDWTSVLPSVEKSMVSIFQAEGPLLARSRVAEVCREQNLPVSSWRACLRYSPCLVKLRRGLYGLVGCEPSLEQIESAQRRYATRHVSLERCEEIDLGKVRLVLRLSEYGVRRGGLTYPINLGRRLAGVYHLRARKGKYHGTIRLRERGCSSLRGLFRFSGAAPGDSLVLVIDQEKKEAVAAIEKESPRT